MAEDPVGAHGQTGPPWPHPYPYPPAAPVVVRRDLVPAALVLAGTAMTGLALGWLWSVLAPSQLVQVVDADRIASLRTESYHRFDALILFVVLALGAGVVTGTAAWLMRERRGPVLLVGAVAGAALAGWLATRTGVSFAESAYALENAPAVGDVIELAPRLESPWGLLAWPFGAAAAYGVAAAWNGHDDLGRRLG